MNRRQYVREIASSNFVEALDRLFGPFGGLLGLTSIDGLVYHPGVLTTLPLL